MDQKFVTVAFANSFHGLIHNIVRQNRLVSIIIFWTFSKIILFVSTASVNSPYKRRCKDGVWYKEIEFKSSLSWAWYLWQWKKKCWASSTLPQLHRGESVIFFIKRSKFRELQFVRKRVCWSELFCYRCKNIEALALFLYLRSVWRN